MKRVQKSVGYVKSFDGTKIYYEIRGQGPPLVLCYGIGCPFNHWIHQVRHFSQNYSLILFDYRAHHKSEIPEDVTSMRIDFLCEDIKILLKHLNIKMASFWGHSFGVQVLIRFFELYPEYIQSFVFINGFARHPFFGKEIASKIMTVARDSFYFSPKTVKYVWKRGTYNFISALAASFLGGFNIRLTSFKDIEIYLKGVSNLDFEYFLTLFEDMLFYDGTDVLDKIKVPTLIIVGKQDQIIPGLLSTRNT